MGLWVLDAKQWLVSAVRGALPWPVRWDEALDKRSKKLKAEKLIYLSKKLG